MAEYIEKQAFSDCYRKSYCGNCGKRRGVKNGKMKVLYEIGDAPCRACDIDDMITAVENFTSADVQQVRHGRNIYSIVPEHCEFKCSLCGAELSTIYGGKNDFGMDGGYLKYCPNCGAKMDKEEEK